MLLLAYQEFSAIIHASMEYNVPHTAIRILLVISLITFIPVLKPKYYYTPLIPPLIILLFKPMLIQLIYAFLESLTAFYLNIILKKQYLRSSIQYNKLLLFTIFLSGIIAFTMGIGYLTGLASHRLYENIPLTGGEAETIFYFLHKTLAYRLIIVALIGVLAYKSTSTLLELLISWRSEGPLREALLDRLRDREYRILVLFEGSQYPALSWGAGLLLTLLVAPVLYPSFLKGVETMLELVGVNGGQYTPVMASLLATLLLWPVMKLLVQALNKPNTYKRLLHPRIDKLIVGASTALLVILLLLALQGYDPITYMLNVLRGRPPTNDPFTSFLQEPSEKYYRNLVKALDLLVKLFWGG